MKCDICKWKYPSSYLHTMMINGTYTEPICGICALEVNNKALGTNMRIFHGAIAETTRLAAIRWRENHPNDAPAIEKKDT